MWPFATTRSRSPSLSKSARAVPHFSGRKVRGPTPVVLARVLEEGVAEALVEGREVLREVGDEEVGDRRRRPRRRRRRPCWPGPPVAVEGGEGRDADLLEVAVALVAIEVVGIGVVGHVDVEVAVVVEVGGAHRESEAEGEVLHAGRFRGVHEAALLVAEEVVGRALEAERAEGDLLEAAPRERALRLAARRRACSRCSCAT